MPKYEVDITHTITFTAKVEVEAGDEDQASDMVLRQAEEEAKQLESQWTIEWSAEEDFFEVDDITEVGEDESPSDPPEDELEDDADDEEPGEEGESEPEKEPGR